jgi:membrane protein insertase Oxa1/YidC/SpoIIIJ
MLVCSSPQLIAAYHVLRRLSEPRHSPYALNCFKKLKKNNETDKNLPHDKIILGITTFFQYVKELDTIEN